MKKVIDEMYLDYARKLYDEWKASNFKGSLDDNHLPTEEDVMLNFAEWIVREKIQPIVTVHIVNQKEEVPESEKEQDDEFYRVDEWIDKWFGGAGQDAALMKRLVTREFNQRGIPMETSVKDVDPNILHSIQQRYGTNAKEGEDA